MTEETLDETRIIADWDYWYMLKSKTLSSANDPKWRKKNTRTRAAQQNAQHSYLEKWARNKYRLLNKKINKTNEEILWP